MGDEKHKLFLLDAMALIYRAHFAFSRNPRVNSKGMNTGAAFGFTNTLMEILQKQKPSHIAVAFDTAAPTFRHEQFSEYKANRQAQPEDIRSNIPYIKKIIEAFNIPILEKDGFEADDIIGTLAKKAAKDEYEVYMMTPDKDFAQLVEDHIYLYKPAYMGNAVEVLGVEEVKKKFDIERVDQVRDILGLHGDSSDNIPGIPGVGAKTAVKFLKEYGSIEELLKNTDQLKGKQKENVENFADQAILSKELATINTEVPIDFDAEALQVAKPDREKLTEVFKELEFRTMLKRVFDDEPATPAKKKDQSSQLDMFSSASAQTDTEEEEVIPSEARTLESQVTQYHALSDASDVESLLSFLQKQEAFAMDVVTASEDFDSEVLGAAISYYPGEAYFIAADDLKSCTEILRPALENPKVGKVSGQMKSLILNLKRYGIDLKGRLFDTALIHYLMDPETSHSLEVLAERELNYQLLTLDILLSRQGLKKGKLQDISSENLRLWACERCDLTRQLSGKLFQQMNKDQRLADLYKNMEEPLIMVLAGMEYYGVKVNTDTLAELSMELEEESRELERKIFEDAGESFNIGSPKQLGEILFEKLQLVEKPKKTKTGQYATGEEILSKLAADHAIVSNILEFRNYQKLKSTYVDALPKMISTRDGRIHTDYRQTVAATGRLSSNNPNLQNIPIRTERGREIRKAFVPENENFSLISADYSQIELRIMASFAKDEHMIEAFRQGRDIHTTTAARVFKVGDEEVDANMRRMAKSANFGIIYGISAFGLSQNLNIPRSEAKEIIDAYFAEFPSVKQYMDGAIEKARNDGYVETIAGRRRYLNDINSRNATLRGYAERNAINAPIQGSAADIIKLAMIDIDEWLLKNKAGSRMIMQVHDELVFEVPRDETDMIMNEIPKLMMGASKLEVPMEVEIGKGENWLQAH